MQGRSDPNAESLDAAALCRVMPRTCCRRRSSASASGMFYMASVSACELTSSTSPSMTCMRAFAALRLSARSDGGEQVPVGASGVEQGSDPVVGEVAEPKRGALDPLDEVVDGLGGPVRDTGSLPRGDLVGPADDGAAELAVQFAERPGRRPTRSRPRSPAAPIRANRAGSIRLPRARSDLVGGLGLDHQLHRPLGVAGRVGAAHDAEWLEQLANVRVVESHRRDLLDDHLAGPHRASRRSFAQRWNKLEPRQESRLKEWGLGGSTVARGVRACNQVASNAMIGAKGVRGLAHRILKRWRGPERHELLLSRGILVMGRHSYGKPVVHVYQEPTDHVVIGAFCSIAREVEFLPGGNHRTDWVSTYPFRVRWGLAGAGSDGHPVSKGQITIGNDVWIGRGAKVLGGVSIGSGAVIAAYSVVVKDVAPYTIVAGNPASIVRERFDVHTVRALLELAWWDWPDELIRERVSGLNGSNVEDFLRLYYRQSNQDEER